MNTARIAVGDRVRTVDHSGHLDGLTGIVTEVKGRHNHIAEVELDFVVLLADDYEVKQLSFTEAELEILG